MLRFRSLGLEKSQKFLPIFQSQSLGLDLIYNNEMSRCRRFSIPIFVYLDGKTWPNFIQEGVMQCNLNETNGVVQE